MDLGLAGKVAVVMGGSRGIGKAVGRGLAREGAHVALVARNLEGAQASALELAQEADNLAGIFFMVWINPEADVVKRFLNSRADSEFKLRHLHV